MKPLVPVIILGIEGLHAADLENGVGTVLRQGRARASLANLYNWRYKELGDLPNVLSQREYLLANPGMAYEYQFIDVSDSEESSPLPYFYQVGGACGFCACNIRC